MSTFVTRTSAVVALCLLAACPKPQETDTDTGIVPQNDGPVLAHTPVAGPLVQGDALPIELTATDEDVVEQVTLYYRTIGDNTWQTDYLDRGDADVWTAQIDGVQVQAPGVEYYFRAQDAADIPGVSYLPDNGLNPYQVEVGVVGQALPFVEDFEDAGLLGVFDLGWNVETDGFPGYPWEIDTVVRHGGEASARHRRGAPDMPSGIDDWLITPALDFDGLAEIELSWFEYGDFADQGVHSVWVSNTTGDPDDGGFVLLADLENPPEEAWARSPVLDLSAYSGDRAVWVAFRYEGAFTDGWWLDDVAIGPLTAELEATEFDGPAAIVSPGETVTLGIDVANVTSKGSDALTVTWQVDDSAAGTFADQPASEAPIDGNATAHWDADFTIDAAWPDNTRIPYTVTATDGVETWTFASSFLVGEPSAATIDMSWVSSGLLQMSVGKGDPAAPDLEIVVISDVVSSGDHTYTVDLTDVAADLPPAPGEDRWWLRVQGALSGRVDAFDITYDGQTYASDDTGTFPANAERLVYLPKPPLPRLTQFLVSPAPAAPGASETVSVTLVNDGPATTGHTVATLVSTDPDVTVTSGPIEVAADGWATATPVSGTLSFDVSAAHVDSEPVTMDVVVTDDVESFVLPQTVQVPWPVLAVNSVVIDDTAGDGDGLLDAGETANLDITLANVGDLSSNGTVRCVLSRTGGAAAATVTVANGTFGTLAAGAERHEDAFQVQVTSGSAGDALDLSLACTDTSRSYTVPVVLDLGEVPWQALSVVPDPVGDANGYAFDFVRGYWRTDGTTLDFRFDSSVPIAPSSLFIEAWASSAGGSYSNYQFVLQGGIARLRGYDFGVFTTLTANATVDHVDADTVVISWDLAPMGLLLERLSIGFAAGFCGGDTYYCDHFQDGWGDPYQTGFDTSRWFDLSW